MKRKEIQLTALTNPTAFIGNSALINNLRLIKEINKYSKIFPVVKANAYGHGIDIVSKAISSFVDGYAVARLDEALELRAIIPQKPILVMSAASIDDIQNYHSQNIIPIIHNKKQLKNIVKKTDGLWFKVDTGMHRLGMSIEDLKEIIDDYDDITIMSHFHSAQRENLIPNIDQLKYLFNNVNIDTSNHQLSWDNSSTILQSKSNNYDSNLRENNIFRNMKNEILRPGIMLYGVDPLNIPNSESEKLIQVMNLCAPILSIRKIKKGESVGYNQTWISDKTSFIATVGIGYGDGYPRNIKKNTPILIKGKKAFIVGEVSMDTLCVDVSHLIESGHEIDAGETATLWGDGLNISEIASNANTIAYELLSRLMPRVKRVLVD